jgi:hypothetical protein
MTDRERRMLKLCFLLTTGQEFVYARENPAMRDRLLQLVIDLTKELIEDSKAPEGE